MQMTQGGMDPLGRDRPGQEMVLTASGGAKASDLGTISRPGGGKQVTYDGLAPS